MKNKGLVVAAVLAVLAVAAFLWQNPAVARLPFLNSSVSISEFQKSLRSAPVAGYAVRGQGVTDEQWKAGLRKDGDRGILIPVRAIWLRIGTLSVAFYDDRFLKASFSFRSP